MENKGQNITAKSINEKLEEMIYPSNYPTVAVIHTTDDWAEACAQVIRRRALDRQLNFTSEGDFAKAVKLAAEFSPVVIDSASGEKATLYDLSLLMPEFRFILVKRTSWSYDGLTQAVGLLGRGSHLAIIDLEGATDHEEVMRFCGRLRGTVGFYEVWVNSNTEFSVKGLSWKIGPTPSAPMCL